MSTPGQVADTPAAAESPEHDALDLGRSFAAELAARLRSVSIDDDVDTAYRDAPRPAADSRAVAPCAW